MTLAMQLQNHVEGVLAQPRARRNLRERIDAFAAEQGMTLAPGDADGLSQLSEDYVRAVVDLLIACDVASTRAGAAEFAAPILRYAAGYFLQEQDLIPEEKGLYGLLDDAYLACRFVARISETFQAANGVPLLDVSLDQKSPIIRLLIGEPIASALDTDVEQKLALVIQQIQFSRMSPWPVQVREWAQRENAVNVEAQISSIVTG
jgi:hypothetical protein